MRVYYLLKRVCLSSSAQQHFLFISPLPISYEQNFPETFVNFLSSVSLLL